jgi:hypothetical protein
MLFGHNSNVSVSNETVHVQTEDRGVNHAFIDTTVHWRGRVLHRRTNNYQDLLPLDAEREAVLKVRVDDQHRAVVDEIRSGALQLPFPASAAPEPVPVPSAPPIPANLKVELTNSKTWLAGKRATLQLLVKDHSGNAVPGAMTSARVEGAELPAVYTHETGLDGSATLEFEMPKLSGPEVSLVIEASSNGAKGHLRFQLKAKPRT